MQPYKKLNDRPQSFITDEPHRAFKCTQNQKKCMFLRISILTFQFHPGVIKFDRSAALEKIQLWLCHQIWIKYEMDAFCGQLTCRECRLHQEQFQISKSAFLSFWKSQFPNSKTVLQIHLDFFKLDMTWDLVYSSNLPWCHKIGKKMRGMHLVSNKSVIWTSAATRADSKQQKWISLKVVHEIYV